ncbi:HD domain-containing protein [Methanotrichaceae archaeon M04Ac]|uniref:HD domain-containing protein n=1 Tax=Candidatus Methanocrinis alkalitolerans TaxID=3033395 RepID=A0ABT5XHM6_9EURY|nr:HD domain-containing protein [Candidatus Methanocrinis alkalitolerans]MDF0594225.1 HD domain-containing protein [Candidatus Methanocrinis alkalitolerans]
MSHKQEIRDPIYNFIRLGAEERKVLDSVPFQRLRHIHQLALTSFLYPGATHKRFEHSLGVMELAGRVYDVVTDPDNLIDRSVRKLVPRKGDYKYEYWRLVLRMAALCHDLGHLPFSHAAEKELLPDGWNHERLTLKIIRSEEMKPIWDDIKVNPEDVAMLAVGPENYKGKEYSDLEAILSEIIVGDAFGVDRMDYLLRDSHHIGVAYGRFDHYRLIDSLRILPRGDDSQEPGLGVDEGGLHSAEALILARYFMFTQVYCHHVRRIYDIHLKDFLMKWLPKGHFSTELDEHLAMTDNEINVALLRSANDAKLPGHDAAKRIVRRNHFRLLYQRNPSDLKKNQEACRAVYEAVSDSFGEDDVRFDSYRQTGGGLDFPVLGRDGRIASSLYMSETLARVPVVAEEYVFISPEIREDAKRWLEKNRESIIASSREEDEES